MITARLIWIEHPFDAGFCITDDTDDATLIQTKAVYDFLVQHKFVTTKTVWPYSPSEPCGIPATPQSTLRGITLENLEYLNYCKMLSSQGYEICLHGASAGNNIRKSTVEAFNFLNTHFGDSDTFICHSKNAENLYWENKVTSLFPFKQMLEHYSKHTTSGEITESPYFWGDICQSRVKQIRLYRTREINTLKVNPSMPYYDKNKPYVNYWFSATKRRIADCATDYAIESLKKENGLIVLYQYLHRYADFRTGLLNNRFVAAIERLSSEHYLQIATTSKHMDRLRRIRNVVIFKYRNLYWFINSDDSKIKNLQFKLSSNTNLEIDSKNIRQIGSRIVIVEIESKTSLHFQCDLPLQFTNCRFIELQVNSSKTVLTPSGNVTVRINEKPTNLPNDPDIVFRFEFQKPNEKNRELECIPMSEEYRLIINQFTIMLREFLFKGRNINSDKYLDATKEILLENHDNW